MNESLLFSYDGDIELLPALPPAWETGAIYGLMARTRTEVVQLEWSPGMTTAAIRGDIAQELRVACGRDWSNVLVEGATVKAMVSGKHVTLQMTAGAIAKIVFTKI